MIIELRPEEQRIINEAVRSGEYTKPEDVISEALSAWQKQRTSQRSSKPAPHAKNLVELFANSPFKGLNMDFECDRDMGRDIVW